MNVVRFLHWLRQCSWDVILYANPETMLTAEAKERGILVRSVVTRMHSGDMVNAWRLARMIRQDNVRRLIIHQSQDMFLGVFAKLLCRRNTKLLYSQHMHIGGTKKDVYHSWLYGKLDAWITPVQWLADRVLEKTTINPERIHIVTRGVELDKFTDGQPDKATARRYFDLPENSLIIGVIGRLDPKKCQDVVIRALSMIHTAGHPAHLLLVGNQSFNEGDEYVTQIHKLVNELNLGEFIHFHQHQEEVEYAYAALDIFVLASRSECYGMVTIEAMCSGLPVIGTNDGGTVSLINHGHNGLLVTPKDVDELTNALLELISNPEKRYHLAEQARHEALKKFSHTRQCKEWENVFFKID